MVDDLGGAVDVAVDFLSHGLEDVGLNRLSFPGFPHQIVARGLDDRKGLVQLMGDTRRHFSQGCHLAGLNQLLLSLQALGDVARRYQQHLPPIVIEGRDPDSHENRSAILRLSLNQEGMVSYDWFPVIIANGLPTMASPEQANEIFRMLAP